ncbi:hypothetical protein QQS21_005692 [Conoideocrella luteorostrata]|uniref:Uncharacterized protein n=1 Tax=Conoideocrella luteorostrata TaxID=1105319 RepID=A0AAJ0CRW8_9HYPO|nr:hypothetical protein QQS21_005692 [Conoideocrella luteorostrata]
MIPTHFMSLWHCVSTLLFVLVLLAAPSSAGWSNNFDIFFPSYNRGFQTIIHQNCSVQYEQYLQDRHDKSNITSFAPRLAGFGDTHLVNVLVNCILEATPEVIKAKLAAAGVILGLTPAILSTVGVQACDTAILAVLGCKPLLAVLLAFGSPAVFAHRSSEYRAAVLELAEFHMPGGLALRSPYIKIMIHSLVYLLAVGSIVNVAHLAYELGDKVIFVILPTHEYMASIWIFVGVVIHVFAATAVYFYIDVQALKPQQEQEQHRELSHSGSPRGSAKVTENLDSRLKGFSRWVTNEFRINQNAHFTVSFRTSSLLFYGFSWFTSVLTAVHIIFGSALFAGALFISVNDAVMVIGRFLISAVLCRVLVKIELFMLRPRMSMSRAQEKDKKTLKEEVDTTEGKIRVDSNTLQQRVE